MDECIERYRRILVVSSENKRLISTHIHTAWNMGDFEKLKHSFARQFFYKTTFTDEILNAEQYLGLIATLREAIPDILVEIEVIMSEQNRVMTQVSFIGQVEKSIYGIPVSNKIITFPAMSVWEVENNRINSVETLMDMTSISRQVGQPIQPQVPLSIRSNPVLNIKKSSS